MKKQMKMSGIGFYLLVLAVIFCAVYFSGNIESSSSDSYSIANLKKDLGNGNVTSASISQNQEIPTGEVVVKLKSGKNVDFYVSDVKDVQELLDQWNVSYKLGDVKKTSWVITTLLPYGLGFVAIFLLFSFLSAQSANSGGGNSKMMNFGKSRARRIDPEEPHAKRFKDVAGLKEEKEELEEIVDFLANPGRYTDVGARIPKGIILVGPPGTGKTLLAKAVAGEAGVPFFSLSGSDFVEMFVGVGASRVRDMFAEAKKNAPCIVFIDEIDAVARKRGSGLGGGHDEREQTLNQMLVEMDGFGVNEGIIVMAATNRVDILDPAILRPGRFDRKVTVGRPDVRGREEILEVHAKGKPLGDDVDLKKIARTTVGFTGADLENLLNESAIVCAKEGRKFIEQEDISKSFIKIGIGKEKKSKIISEKDQKITAYHEAGHAILFHVLPDVGPVHMVSIIPTGSGAAGYTMPLPERDETFMTKGKMKQDIIASLGGRIAESLIFDDITTGASQDIKQATSTAKAMVTKYGFSENVGMINYADEDEVFIGRDFGRTSRDYSEDVAKTIDNEVKAIIDDAYAQAKSILEEHMDVLHKASKILMKKEKLTGQEFRKIMKGEEIDEENVAEFNIFESIDEVEKEGKVTATKDDETLSTIQNAFENTDTE